MSTVHSQAAGPQFNPHLGRDAAIGGGAGWLAGHPILGALGGIAYNLFKTPGMADGLKQAAADAFSGIGGGGSVMDAIKGLGASLFGGAEGAQTRPNPSTAMANAQSAEKKSGIPGWAKWLAAGGAGLALFNTVFDRFNMNGFGGGMFGGFGMSPFMGPMAGMMGMGAMGMGMPGMDMMGMGMMGPGMGYGNDVVGGMSLMDLLITAGVGVGAYHFLKR